MKRLLQLVLLFAITCLAISCFKEDEKVTPHQPGNTKVDTIPLTSLYKYQVYYDLGTGTAALTTLRKKWDLSFESTPEGWHILLNTSCFMYAASIQSRDFGLPADTAGVAWRFDNSNGNRDSTAIGEWFHISGNDTISNGNWYVINKGLDEEGNPKGFKQLSIDSLSNGTYYFRTADFKGGNVKSFSIPKAAFVNQVNYSFDETAVDFSEPDNRSWDLLFTQYTTLLYTDQGDPYPYLVTGVLLNPNMVEVARDSITPFTAITFESAKGLTYSKQQDFIGYDWKFYSFNTGAYTVRNNQVYIIRDVAGFYYKFRFLGFYNEKGEKGFPSIEFQQL